MISPPAWADQREREQVWLEQVQSGELMPVDQIMQALPADLQGRVLEVEIEEKGTRLRYEIELLTPDQRYLEVKVDARTGEILKVERE